MSNDEEDDGAPGDFSGGGAELLPVFELLALIRSDEAAMVVGRGAKVGVDLYGRND